MNTTLKRIFCIVLAASLVLLLSGCKKSEPADSSADPDVNTEQEGDAADQGNGIYFDEENEGVEIETKKTAVDEFVGSWTATSDQAMYQFGNVDINVKADGKWDGNIATEEMEGTWTETPDGIHLTNSFFDCDLKFTSNNVLVMLYSPARDGDYITTVLTAK